MNPLFALALSGALLTATPPDAPLPPGHPPLRGQAPAGAAKLPPNHPPMPGTASATGTTALPPSHPTLSATSDDAQVPAGHPPMKPGSVAPSAEELIKQLDATPGVKDGDKPFEIASTLGNLYVSNARYQDAIAFFRQAEKKAEGLRAFFVSERAKAKGAGLADSKACPSPEAALEQQVELLAAAKLAPAESAACALRALAPALDATVRRGNAHVLLGDPQAALEAYASVLTLSALHADALYSRAALLLDAEGEKLASVKEAKTHLENFVAKHAFHPRIPTAQKLLRTCEEAIAAGGMSRRAAVKAQERKVLLAEKGLPGGTLVASSGGAGSGKPPAGDARQNPKKGPAEVVLTPEMVEAVQNTERTPELEAGLAKLVDEGEEHLAKGRFDQALGAYRRVVPFQPENARAKAGMAWALVKLDRQPMADRVWGVAVADAKAVEALGDRLKAQGDAAGAKALWSKLAQSRPELAAALKDKLK